MINWHLWNDFLWNQSFINSHHLLKISHKLFCFSYMCQFCKMNCSGTQCSQGHINMYLLLGSTLVAPHWGPTVSRRLVCENENVTFHLSSAIWTGGMALILSCYAYFLQRYHSVLFSFIRFASWKASLQKSIKIGNCPNLLYTTPPPPHPRVLGKVVLFFRRRLQCFKPVLPTQFAIMMMILIEMEIMMKIMKYHATTTFSQWTCIRCTESSSIRDDIQKNKLF